MKKINRKAKIMLVAVQILTESVQFIRDKNEVSNFFYAEELSFNIHSNV